VFLKPTIKEITDQTDISIEYENIKKGKSVVGFKFFVKEKPKVPKITKIDDAGFAKLSEPQINKYSNILSKNPSLSDLSNF
jgi:plasmid replication initiation protein